MADREFRDLLRSARQRAAVSQRELAERAGISERAVSDLERGLKKRPHPFTLRALAEALGLEGEAFADFAAAGSRPGLADARPAERARHNLPVQPTPFLGRERDLADVLAGLRDPGRRLLTLTGPGGSGKSRLALEAAAGVLEEFDGGAWVAPLSEVRDPGQVPAAVASVLNARLDGGQPVPRAIAAALAGRRTLLVIDNAEHVLDAVAGLAAGLLDAAPGLTILATSRAPLRLRAEREQPVAPLALPGREPEQTPQQLSQYDAFRLFVERAGAVLPEFAIDAATAPAIAEICHRLDGMPLAIELAAARVAQLSPDALLGRLPALESGPRDAPARQRTLRAAIAWSHDLLSPDEATLFRRLAVFAGPVPPDVVAGVSDPGGELDVPGALQRLLAHGLLREERRRASAPGVAMLDTVRAFARERLDDARELEMLEHRHALRMRDAAEAAAPHLTGPDRDAWTDRLRAVEADLRAAFDWALRCDPDSALRLTIALFHYWGYERAVEAREWSALALAAGEDADPRLRARALAHDAEQARTIGFVDVLRERAEAALDLADATGDDGVRGWALALLANAAHVVGDAERAADGYDRAERLLTEAGEPWFAQRVTTWRGLLASEGGDPEASDRHFDRGLAIARDLGDLTLVGTSLGLMAREALNRGDLARATAIAHDHLDLAHSEPCSAFVRLDAALTRGMVAARAGDFPLLAALIAESEPLLEELAGDRHLRSSALNEIGYFHLAMGDLERGGAAIRAALDALGPDDPPKTRSTFTHSVGDVLLAEGRLAEAADTYGRCLRLAEEAGGGALLVEGALGLAGVAAALGIPDLETRLNRTAALLRSAPATAEDRDRLDAGLEEMWAFATEAASGRLSPAAGDEVGRTAGTARWEAISLSRRAF